MVSTAIHAGEDSAARRDEKIADELGHHLSIRIEDVDSTASIPRSRTADSSAPHLLADAFESMTR